MYLYEKKHIPFFQKTYIFFITGSPDIQTNVKKKASKSCFLTEFLGVLIIIAYFCKL